MTREELKRHCESQIQYFEQMSDWNKDEQNWEIYEKHKLILELLEQEPSDDCVDRSEVKKIAKEMYLEVANMELDVDTISDCISYTSSKCREVLERKLQALPPVTPTRKKGHWINFKAVNTSEIIWSECSECKEGVSGCAKRMKYCPNCGADMREVKE